MAEQAGVVWRWYSAPSGNDAPDWATWDALVMGSQGGASFFLDSRQVRGAMSVQERRVWALVAFETGEEGEERWLGMSVVEDVLAQSHAGATHAQNGSRLYQRLGRALHGRSGVLQWRVRVAGSVLGSGEHAYRCRPDVEEVGFRNALLQELQRSVLPGHPQSIDAPPVCLIKDFLWQESDPEGERTPLAGGRRIHPGWVDLEFDPVMTVHIDPDWKALDDCLAAMRTKARTKVKRILDCSRDCGFYPWGLAEVREHADALHALYNQVFGGAGFRLGHWYVADLVAQKEAWGDDFRVVAVYHDGVLRGFQCGYLMPDRVEAFFVGFDRSLHRELAMYQRMLIEFISWGIERGAKEVVMGRTALDIKSSVGALPQRAYCSVWFRNPAVHAMARRFAACTQPAAPQLKQAWRSERAPLRAVGTVGT